MCGSFEVSRNHGKGELAVKKERDGDIIIPFRIRTALLKKKKHVRRSIVFKHLLGFR